MQHQSVFVKIFSALFVAALFCSCSNVKETRSGVKISYLKKGSGGTEIKGGRYLLVNMLLKDQRDSVQMDTKKNDMPFFIPMMDSVQKGDMTNEVLDLLRKGDSVTFKVPAKNLFERTFGGSRPFPPNTDSTAQFTFNVGLADVMTLPQAQQYRMRMDSIRRVKQLGKDMVAIDNFLKEKNTVAMSTKSGLRYAVTQPGKGENVKEGETAKVHYVGRLMNGKVFDTSVESVAKANDKFMEGRPYEPLTLTLGMHQVIPGWEEGVALMNKGSKMTLYIPSSLAYGPQQMGADIAPNSCLIFDMELVDVISPKTPNPLGLADVDPPPKPQQHKMRADSALRAKGEKDRVIQLGKDIAVIENFLKENNKIAARTKSGLHYMITKSGKGENVKEGQTAKVHYVGRLMNGKVFDTSVESVAKANDKFMEGRPYEPLTLTLGMHQVIPGWEEGVALMNKGSKMTLYIPSSLAYGPQQMGADIPPNSCLIFDMELVDVISPKTSTP